MRAYHCTDKTRRSSAIILDVYGQFNTAVDEFKQAYGFHRVHSGSAEEYILSLTESRLSLYRDKQRLDLKSNPMTDDLATIFGEWIAKQPGFRAISEQELTALEGAMPAGITLEEFEFPF